MGSVLEACPDVPGNSSFVEIIDGCRFSIDYNFFSVNELFLVVDMEVNRNGHDGQQNGNSFLPREGLHKEGDVFNCRRIKDIFGAQTTPGHCKLILPRKSGWVTSSSLVEQRMNGAGNISSIAVGNLKAGQYYHAPSLDVRIKELDRCFFNGQGTVIVLKDLPYQTCYEKEREMEAEFQARLNIPWTLPGRKPAEKRVALIRGRMTEEIGRPVYEAVASLNIKLVVIDELEHWATADTESNRALREDFIVTDMTEDDGLVTRLIHSIRAHPLPIHGVFTCSDNYLVAVAEVAKYLGFATSPPSAYKICVDKHLSRSILQDIPGQIARVASYKDLQSLISTGDYSPRYPVIVKPTKGWSSECVFRVNDAHHLQEAVERACQRHADSASCVIEPYFEGPEVDVNFVMLNGEVLFSEVADEPPREGDHSSAGFDASFSDVTTISPSALPPDEQSIILNTIREMLLSIHMDTGVFHAEARLTHSRCYHDTSADVYDLQRPLGDTSLRSERPVCRLLEINARPPGYTSTLSTLQAYGINYFQLHALFAIRDYERLRILSVPYDYQNQLPRNHDRAQGWVKLMHISAPNGCGSGTFRTSSGLGPVADLLLRHPEMKEHVYLARDEVKSGDKVNEYTSGGRTCIGHLGVMSKVSRHDVIRLGDRVKAMLDIDIQSP